MSGGGRLDIGRRRVEEKVVGEDEQRRMDLPCNLFPSWMLNGR